MPPAGHSAIPPDKRHTYIKEFLGPKSLDSTLVYINLENAIFGGGNNSEFHVKVTDKP